MSFDEKDTDQEDDEDKDHDIKKNTRFARTIGIEFPGSCSFLPFFIELFFEANVLGFC